MRVAVLLLAALGLASCGSADATGTSSIDPAQLAGSWEFTRAANPNCTGAAGAATYYVKFPAPTGGTAYNIVATWDVVSPYRFSWTATGNVDLQTRAVQLNFWQTTLSVGEVMTGTLDANLQFTGTTTDPKPGYQPHWVLSSCTWPVTGHRVGP